MIHDNNLDDLLKEDILKKAQSDISYKICLDAIKECIENEADVISTVINLIINLNAMYIWQVREKNNLKKEESDELFIKAITDLTKEILKKDNSEYNNTIH